MQRRCSRPAIASLALLAATLAVAATAQLWFGAEVWLVTAASLALAVLLGRALSLRYRAERRHLEDVRRLHRQTLEALALAIDARDPCARGHARRVQAYAEELGRLVLAQPAGFFAEPPPRDWLEALEAAALLHDVGKLGTPDRLLRAPEFLSRGEKEKLRDHVRLGSLILERMPFPGTVGRAVRAHHEQWDGGGYPDGLRGETIPLEARIIALADGLDRLRRPRIDLSAPPLDTLVGHVARHAGTLFDPRLADLYCAHAAVIELRMAELDLTQPTGPAGDGGAANDPVLAGIGDAPREAAALYDLACRLGSSLELDESLPLVAARLLELLPAHSCAIYLAEERGARLVPRHVSGPLAGVLARRVFAPGEGTTGWVFDTGEPVLNADPRVDLGAAASGSAGASRSQAGFPIADDNAVLGVVALYAAGPRAFCGDHRRILETVAPQLTHVLRNALLFAETRATSMTDALTGLPNNRYLYAQLDKELARATRKGIPLSVVVLDLDGFKPVNDRHGHLAGDAVLRGVARVLLDGFRSGDTLTRYAGDEFVAVLPETTPEEARAIVHRIQERIAKAEFEIAGGTSVRVGISAGAACFPLDGTSVEELIRRADRAMYRDKAERRQRAS